LMLFNENNIIMNYGELFIIEKKNNVTVINFIRLQKITLSYLTLIDVKIF
jgi:hypothetical protein